MSAPDPFFLALAAAEQYAVDADRDAALAALDDIDRLADLAPGAQAFAAALRTHLGALASGEV